MRRSKLIRGNEGVPGNPGIAMMGSQVAPALHITEDTSRRSREHRAELLRFMKEVRKVKRNEFSRYSNMKVCLLFLLNEERTTFVLMDDFFILAAP